MARNLSAPCLICCSLRSPFWASAADVDAAWRPRFVDISSILRPSLPRHRPLPAQELATITHDRSFGQVIEAAIGSIGKATADATVPKITASLTMNIALFTKSIK